MGKRLRLARWYAYALTDRAPELAEEVYQFCEDIGLPYHAGDIGLAGVSDDELLAAAGVLSNWGNDAQRAVFTITPEAVQAAFCGADACQQARKKDRSCGYREPVNKNGSRNPQSTSCLPLS